MKNIVKLLFSKVSGDVVQGNKYVYKFDGQNSNEEFRKVSNNTNKSFVLDQLREFSKSLLRSIQPTSLISFFPNTPFQVKRAIDLLHEEPRRIILKADDSKSPTIVGLHHLTDDERVHHLVLAQGGAGKSHSLRNLGQKLLNEGKIPILLSLDDFSSYEEVFNFLQKGIPKCPLHEWIFQKEVIFLLDGWDQFPLHTSSTKQEAEKRKLLSLLSSARIIAMGRHASPFDQRFVQWDLAPLPKKCVQTTIRTALGESHIESDAFMNFLSYPLMLILYLLLGGKSASKGELIKAFHKQVAQSIDNQEEFLKSLSTAAMDTSLSRSKMIKGEFDQRLVDTSEKYKINGVLKTLEQIGTLGNRGDIIHPIHDLYWEWLVGVGIHENWEEVGYTAASRLDLRDAILLGLESHHFPTADRLKMAASVDITLAALMLPFFYTKNDKDKQIESMIISKIITALEDKSIVSNRYRGIIAAFLSRKRILFEDALNALSGTSNQGYYFYAIDKSLNNNFLWENRDILRGWLYSSYDKKNGRNYILNAIGKSGDSKWLSWIKEMWDEHLLTLPEVTETTLALTSELPYWIESNLKGLIKEQRKAYYLKSASRRGKNLSLAQWIASHYQDLISKRDSTAFHLNDILVSCGDDSLFNNLIKQWDKFNSLAQEYLLFAIKEYNITLIRDLQVKLFPNRIKEEYHILFDYIFEDIPEMEVRKWINSSNHKVQIHGWKTLVKKKQNKAIPELIENLPDTFNLLHSVPSLIAMTELIDPPESLQSELWLRLKGTIQPMLMENFLQVLANIKPHGILSVVRELRHNPRFLPNYHLLQFLKYYKDWQKETGLQLLVQINSNEDLSFEEFLVIEAIRSSSNEDIYFLTNLCSYVQSRRVIRFILELVLEGNQQAENILYKITGINYYEKDYVDLLLNSDLPIKEIIGKLKNCLHLLPEHILTQIFDIVKEDKTNEGLKYFLYCLSSSPFDVHINLLSKLLETVILLPEKNNGELYQYLALVLKHYEKKEVLNLLLPYKNRRMSQVISIIRLVEDVKQELLIYQEY